MQELTNNFIQSEQDTNSVSSHFSLLQKVFDTANATDSCRNTTECYFPLRFISSQRIVVALSTHSDENVDLTSTFSIQSQCIARTPIYLAFGLSLPFVLIFCAFL